MRNLLCMAAPKKRRVVLFLFTLLAAFFFSRCSEKAETPTVPTSPTTPPVTKQLITLKILFDNYAGIPGTRSSWGFACVIEGTKKKIVFDTGSDVSIFATNVDTLHVDLKTVDAVVLSHDHYDHTAGYQYVCSKKPGVPVYIGAFFVEALSESVRSAGGVPHLVDLNSPDTICNDVWTTGGLIVPGAGGEQALVVMTDAGAVVVTGCAHPGVIKILTAVKKITDKNILLLLGGFHLTGVDDATVNQIIQQCKAFGVRQVAPVHCTGDAAIALFKAAYGTDCLDGGPGRVYQFYAQTGQ